MRDAKIKEQIRLNLIKFRKETKLSIAKASRLAEIPDENLRRYESGTSGVDIVTLVKLAEAYGHAVDHFHMADPPPADLESRPVFFLRVRPDAEYNAETYAEIAKVIEDANSERLNALRADKAKGKK